MCLQRRRAFPANAPCANGTREGDGEGRVKYAALNFADPAPIQISAPEFYMPQRIQLCRTKGWRKPEGAVVVSRPSKWGNPFTGPGAAELFRELLLTGSVQDTASIPDYFIPWRSGWRTRLWAYKQYIRGMLPEIRGKDLCCWCPLDKPCHADVLLELANA